jgi:hypothetical protein
LNDKFPIVQHIVEGVGKIGIPSLIAVAFPVCCVLALIVLISVGDSKTGSKLFGKTT